MSELYNQAENEILRVAEYPNNCYVPNIHHIPIDQIGPVPFFVAYGFGLSTRPGSQLDVLDRWCKGEADITWPWPWRPPDDLDEPLTQIQHWEFEPQIHEIRTRGPQVAYMAYGFGRCTAIHSTVRLARLAWRRSGDVEPEAMRLLPEHVSDPPGYELPLRTLWVGPDDDKQLHEALVEASQARMPDGWKFVVHGEGLRTLCGAYSPGHSCATHPYVWIPDIEGDVANASSGTSVVIDEIARGPTTTTWPTDLGPVPDDFPTATDLREGKSVSYSHATAAPVGPMTKVTAGCSGSLRSDVDPRVRAYLERHPEARERFMLDWDSSRRYAGRLHPRDDLLRSLAEKFPAVEDDHLIPDATPIDVRSLPDRPSWKDPDR